MQKDKIINWIICVYILFLFKQVKIELCSCVCGCVGGNDTKMRDYMFIYWRA